jgi:hypothetical protein
VRPVVSSLRSSTTGYALRTLPGSSGNLRPISSIMLPMQA